MFIDSTLCIGTVLLPEFEILTACHSTKNIGDKNWWKETGLSKATPKESGGELSISNLHLPGPRDHEWLLWYIRVTVRHWVGIP
jgi:hypothetical protein